MERAVPELERKCIVRNRRYVKRTDSAGPEDGTAKDSAGVDGLESERTTANPDQHSRFRRWDLRTSTRSRFGFVNVPQFGSEGL